MTNPNPSRAAQLAALAVATDAQGHVDLTAFQAQLLIQQHQSIDGLDAPSLARTLAGSPAMARPDGREQLEPMLQAFGRQLGLRDAERLAETLDANHLTDSRLERNWERLAEAASEAWNKGSRALERTDVSISDGLAQARRWAEQVCDNPDNRYLQRAAGHIAGEVAGKAQENYGALKGTTGQGLQVLGDTVDLASFTLRFSRDRDFRNMIVGAAGMYAAEVWNNPSKPVDDASRAAKQAWDEWKQGLERATREGKAPEYIGQAEGAAGVEILAALVPVSKLPKLAKVAKVADVLDDGVPLHTAGPARRLSREGIQALTEVGDDIRRAQAKGGLAADSADLMLDGLAGVRRSQGQLSDLVDGLRQTGHLDELLQSGALRPRELGYLARQNLDDFRNVSFDQALTASIGGRALGELKRHEVGEIGEAIMVHDLAQKGYRDIVPIQNNSGHGNDVVAINPRTDRWEIFEVKTSAHVIAKGQGPDPQPLVDRRIDLAIRQEGHWTPHKCVGGDGQVDGDANPQGYIRHRNRSVESRHLLVPHQPRTGSRHRSDQGRAAGRTLVAQGGASGAAVATGRRPAGARPAAPGQSPGCLTPRPSPVRAGPGCGPPDGIRPSDPARSAQRPAGRRTGMQGGTGRPAAGCREVAPGGSRSHRHHRARRLRRARATCAARQP